MLAALNAGAAYVRLDAGFTASRRSSAHAPRVDRKRSYALATNGEGP
jgi:hypothetical protein